MNEWWASDGGYTWRLVAQFVDDGRVSFNRACIDLEPWQIVSYTLSVACFFIWLRKLLKADRPLSARIRAVIFSAFRTIPWVNAQIKEEMEKARKDLEETIHQYDKRKEFYKFLPEQGLTTVSIVHEAELYKTMNEFSFYEGRVSGVIFADFDEEHRALLQKIFELFVYSDSVYPDLFPGCRKMEAEIVRIVASLLHGGPGCCGTVTSNDTESNMLACFAYRNRASARGIRHPEMLVPVTAHAAFEKAAKVLRIRIRHIPVDKNQRVDVGAMKRAISNETCMLVASAPNYSFGTIDDIEAISELSQRYDVPLHVDATLGGFILSIMERCDFRVKSFDFRVPGVTSISCDVQKYGFAPNGTSLILYRDSSLLHYQYFCDVEWPGGIYMTPTLAGNRDGCAIALTWATLLYNGRRGYTERTEAIINAVREIRTGIEKCLHIQLLCESDVTTVVFTTRGLDVYALADRMNKLGWVLSTLQNPPAVHICVTMNHTKSGVVENFLRELNMACEDLVSNPQFSHHSRTAAIYGMVSVVPDLVEEISHMYLDSCYAVPLPLTGRTLSAEGRKKSLIPD
ncbi:sphingosine-1-phosphate lyase 1 [Loa loa]|uniref:sphinganine-1-phosphate aldolase n=1 Tax=Loa loa TaxID=7209 RepID=A0A1I7W112_LOALO|nr:sphingosine-1-phosphate lyase 1 [Loa loa]EFO28024.1 sphingosine-1-phosphate lyase 1 [Loa loa]